MRSWWAEIEEWGDKPEPAQFILKANKANTIYGTLSNINQLKIALNDAPVDRLQDLSISINGLPVLTLNTPLPETVFVQKDDGNWKLSTSTSTPSVRRHTPGGTNLLYNGEPLLIVYGTNGTDGGSGEKLAYGDAGAARRFPGRRRCC